MEDEVQPGGCLIDWHACDLFPRSWIDLVVVLRVQSNTLYDRLTARYGLWSLRRVLLTRRRRRYPEAKLQENLDAEIMDVLLQEARDAYDEEIIVELSSDNSEEMESNIDRIESWISQWKVNNHSNG